MEAKDLIITVHGAGWRMRMDEATLVEVPEASRWKRLKKSNMKVIERGGDRSLMGRRLCSRH